MRALIDCLESEIHEPLAESAVAAMTDEEFAEYVASWSKATGFGRQTTDRIDKNSVSGAGSKRMVIVAATGRATVYARLAKKGQLEYLVKSYGQEYVMPRSSLNGIFGLAKNAFR